MSLETPSLTLPARGRETAFRDAQVRHHHPPP
jgi:hypothetical protein